MTKGQNRVAEAVLQCLSEYLDAGVIVEPSILDFTESSCGVTVNDLATSLADEDWEGRDMVLSLLFSPDRQLRLAVEHLLCRGQTAGVNSGDLAARLAANRPTVSLALDDGQRLAEIPLTVELAGILVERLNLEQPLDDSLTALLRELFTDEQVIAVRVAMRCRKTVIDDETRSFLEAFFRQAAIDGKQFDELLDLVLQVIGEKPAQKAMDEYLFDKRSSLLSMLGDLLDFDRKRRHYGMEYLLMHRYPVPSQSEEAVRKELVLIEHLITGVLGMPLPDRSHLQTDESDRIGAEAELERLLRDLS